MPEIEITETIVEEVQVQVEPEVDSSNELLPEKGNSEVGSRAIEMLNECFSFRDDLGKPKEWVRFSELRKNKHWKTTSKTKNSLVSANKLEKHHRSVVNMLTNNHPTFNAVPFGEIPEDIQGGVDIITKTISQYWAEAEQQSRYERSVSTGEMYGTVGEKVSFNPDLNKPLGEIETETIDPFYILMYPPGVKEMEKAQAVFHLYPKTVKEARRLWPNAKDEITSDNSLLGDTGDTREINQTRATSQRNTYLNGVTRFLSGSKSSSDSDAEETFIVETWVKDYSFMTETDPVTGQEIETPLYTGNIRRVTMCSAGTTVLSDDNNPSINPNLSEEDKLIQYLYDRFPFSWTQSVTDEGSPFGLSDFTQLSDLNIEYDKNLSRFSKFMKSSMNLKGVNPKNSGVPEQHFTNSPGTLRPTNHIVAQGLGHLAPPPIPQNLIAALGVYKDVFDDISGGFNDVLQGRQQGANVIAYQAIAALLEEATRMNQGKIRNYSKMIRERGRMFLSLAQSWYGPGRFISFEQDGEEAPLAISGEMLRRIPAKLTVVSGSTMPVSNVQKREQAITLYQMKAIDLTELLKAIEWPEYKQVIKRMQAGPIGQFMSTLGIWGIPPELLQMMQQVGTMDPKELKKALEKGELPPFQTVIQQLMGGQQQQQPNPEMMKLQAEQAREDRKLQIEEAKARMDVEETAAKVRKTNAETALQEEKRRTEQLEQKIKVEGYKFDTESMQLKRATTAQNIKVQNEELKLAKSQALTGMKNERAKTVAKIRSGSGKYRERGIISNNEDL